jgi:hypothetical protein
MVKRILFFLTVFMVNVAIARSQSLITTPSDTLVLDTTYASCQTETTLTFNVLNNTVDTLSMNWRVVYNTLPHSWTIAYCYLGTCLYSNIQNHTYPYRLNPGTNSSMQLEVTPVSGAGMGYFQVQTWATGDSANTVTFLNYRATINACTVNGITEVEAASISIYPNPVRDELTVSLPQNLDNGRLDIYNLIGSKVYSQPLSATKDFNVSNLETGIYVARISDGGRIVATKKFTKD